MKENEPAIKLLTLAEAATILKISKRTLHRMNTRIQSRRAVAHSRKPLSRVGTGRGKSRTKSQLSPTSRCKNSFNVSLSLLTFRFQAAVRAQSDVDNFHLRRRASFS
jgi:hypothetical protein